MTFPFPFICPGSGATFTFVAASNSNTTTCSLPAGSASGDLCFFFDSPVSLTTTVPTLVVPAGWTQISDVSATGSTNVARATISYKILNATDISGGSVTGMAGISGGSARKIMGTFRPSKTITNVSVIGLSAQGTSAAPSAQTMTPSPAPLLALASARGAAALTLSGTMTSSGTAMSSSSTAQAAYYELQNAAAASRTISMTDTGAYNTLQSFFIRGS